MHVCVIGAGVVGVSTAQALHQRGCQVTVIEACAGPGQMASFANGAQLSYSFTDPLASPALLAALPQILLGRSSGIRLNHKLDWQYLSWGTRLLWQCLPQNQRRNTRRLEALARRAQELMEEQTREPVPYHHDVTGKLVLLDAEPTAKQRADVERKQSLGMRVELVNRQQAQQLEPAIAYWQSDFKYAIHSADDAVADALGYVRAKVKSLCAAGVNFEYGTRIDAIRCADNGVVLCSGEQENRFDAGILCTGNKSSGLFKNLPLQPSIYPVTGYSVTLPKGPQANRLSITALRERIVLAPLAQQLRVAGFADINPSVGQQQQRVLDLLITAKQIAPDAGEYSCDENHAWVGHRPTTPSSTPQVGPSGVDNVYLNIGHGMLGWTLALATAEEVALAVTETRF